MYYVAGGTVGVRGTLVRTIRSLLGMGIDKNLMIPIPLSILLIDPITYQISNQFSLGEGISTNMFVCINSL